MSEKERLVKAIKDLDAMTNSSPFVNDYQVAEHLEAAQAILERRLSDLLLTEALSDG